jgi:predicted nucleic acid-binding protein
VIYVLDTNAASDILKRYAPVTNNLDQALKRGDRALISQPAYYELTRSLIRHNASAQFDRLNREIMPFLEWVALTDADWQQAAQFWADAARRGKQLSDVDLLVAALAHRLDATLITADDDYAALPVQRANSCSN